MPAYFEENNTPKPGDTPKRSLQKWNSILYDALGDRGPTFFEEGSRPMPGDDDQRSLIKIVALYQP